jgi:RND family efflux transporter MFP subunit
MNSETHDEISQQTADGTADEISPETSQTTSPVRTPRRGRRVLANLVWLLGGIALALLLVAGAYRLHLLDRWLQPPPAERVTSEIESATGTSAATEWMCEEYPEIRQSEPGDCPVDGRPMIPVPGVAASTGTPTGPSEAAQGGADHGGGEREILFYRNPMDPSITSPVPRKDDMGMDYVPVYADETGGSGGAEGDGPEVTIDPAVVQNMNVQTATVERRTVAREIRTVGYLEYDQQKMVSVTTKYPGFVEKVYVNYLGEPVAKGQPLFDIFSPELVQTEQELLSARDFERRMENAPADARERAASLVEAARQRLSYWDITPEQVERLQQTGRVHRTLTVTAPATGVVMMRMAGLEGMGVKPGMELFHIADLSSLWLSVEVFEDQLAWVREGSTADVTLSYFPGEHFTGRVRYVEPEVSEQTRTVSLKLEVPNRGGKLKSGMYATVVFRPPAAQNAVAIPTEAVLRTGERNVVIVALSEGRFVPRDVRLGASGEGYVEVLSGVEPGERVVTSAQFLIDSESNLKAAIQTMLEKKKAETRPRSAMEREKDDA